MEVPGLNRPASPARDQPALAPGTPGTPGRHASPHLTLGPIILPPEQSLAPTVFLKALPIPLYRTVPPGGLQPRAPLVTGIDGGSVPFLLSPLLQPEGPGPAQAGKPVTPTVTVNIVGTLPVLSPGPALGSPGKARTAGKYVCPHCGRDCLKPSVLEKHIRSHTGERPFPCATCGIAFKTQSNLYKHRRTQTHLNNARLSVGSDGAGGSLLEEGDKAVETPGAAGSGDSGSLGGGDGAGSERPLSPGVQGSGHCLGPATHLSPTATSLDLKSEALFCPGSAPDGREAPLDSPPAAPAGPPLASPQRGPRPPEQRSPAAGRASLQPAARAAEKPPDARAAESRLRKCESTDSGYLSRSDSSEQPPAPGSPPHGLSDPGVEAPREGAPRPGGPGAEPRGQEPRLELEKRRLEERIARLISHNQAVVDDPQLDHVRPRKTVLSKQGSIDLPVPYTYKDSFHFEIRALEPGRRRPGAPGPARSPCAAADTARPLLFHSVPTQLSAAVECVPVTRSNSLPFVEGTGPWREPLDARRGRLRPLSPRPVPARPGEAPSSHPRALVRQAAVEDLPGPAPGETEAPAEDRDGMRAAAGEGPAGRGRAAARRPGPRKARPFSQEKWQVYGCETFQRLYQRGSRQRGRGARGAGAGWGAEPDLPVLEEAVGGEGAAQSQDRRTPACADTSEGARPEPWEGPPAAEGFLGTKPAEQGEPVARGRGPEEPGAGEVPAPPALSSREPRGPELGCQLSPVPGPLRGGDLEAPRLVLPDPKLEGGPGSGGDAEGPWQQALVVQRRPSGSSGEPPPAGDKLPSERKKLRVEQLSCLEQLGSLGGRDQALRGPAQDSYPPSLNWDSDSGDGRRTSGASFSVPSVAPRPAGPRHEAPVHGPAAGAPGGAAPLAAQPPDTTFPPKYLLRLPQRETPQQPPGAPGLEGSGDPPCGNGPPQDPASTAGRGLGTHPAPGPAPSGTNNCGEHSSWPRLWGRRKGVPGEEKGDLDTSTPAAGASPGSSVRAPQETASALPTPPCGSGRSEARDAGQLCVGSTRASLHSPWTLGREVAAGRSPCCPLDPSSVVLAPPPAGWPALARSRTSESSSLCGPQGPFPSLRAEPRLTWCCLGGSLPLPSERKEKAWVLHRPGSSARAPGAEAGLVSEAESGRRTGTSPAEGGETQPWTLSCPAAPGVTAGPGSEPGRRRGPPRRRARTCRGSSKQRAARRCRGSFLQGPVRLRASRLRKPLRVLRRDCHPPPLEGLDPRRTLGQASSEMAGLSLQGESSCATSASPLGCGNREEKDWRPTSGGSSPSTDPRAVRDRDTWTVQDVIPSASECGDRCPQNAMAGSALALPPDSHMHLGDHSLPSHSGDLPLGLPEAQLLSSQEQISAGPRLPAFLDAQEPLSTESKGSSPRHDTATSVAAVGTSLGSGGGHTTPGAPSAEPQGRGQAAGELRTQSSPDSKSIAPRTSLSLWPGKPSPAPRLSGLIPSRPPGKAHPATLAPEPAPTSSHQEAGRPEAHLPPEGQEKGTHPQGRTSEGGAVLGPRPPGGKDTEEIRESGLVALKADVVPSTPGQPVGVQEASLKTIKKRSLGGMRKQTRVEFSDTSSDDEDRLVIEI
uniref:Zinc finger protein 831 n=2 Tax=Pipistrellus kuhlii TaxID=59472 RepID=A0A7J7RRQ0_PIPKU|nr:zinc finger protein 831 [Pipistrellus kuhlii]